MSDGARSEEVAQTTGRVLLVSLALPIWSRPKPWSARAACSSTCVTLPARFRRG